MHSEHVNHTQETETAKQLISSDAKHDDEFQTNTLGAFHWEFSSLSLTSYSPVTRKPPTNFPVERLPAVYGCITYLLADFFCDNRS